MIREAKPEDLHGLLELYKDLHTDDAPPPDEETLNEVWHAMLADPRHHIFLLESEGQLAASCVLQIIPNLTRGARPYGLVENVVTRRDKRGQGYATRILEHALKLAWDDHCYKVMLLTGRDDEKVFALYEKVGFKRGLKTGFVAKAPA